MKYDLICLGEYKENNVRCTNCIDNLKCSVKKELEEKENEYKKSDKN